MTRQANQSIIHFMHGNSFPSGTYRVFLDHLREKYDVQVSDMLGHHPDYPVDDGWRNLARELIDTLVSRYQQPVILVGHSLGGILSLMVARARPDLVRGVVVIDSPIVAGWRALLVRVSKWLGVDRKYGPARFSEKRKHLWKDKQAAFDHFAAKEIFAIWPPEVLWDYIHAGTVETEDGVTLRFTREVETAVYLGLPHGLGRLIRRRPPVPIGFVGGTESVECAQAGDFYTRKLMEPNYTLIPGGHLIPMETPKQTAQAVLAMLAKLQLT